MDQSVWWSAGDASRLEQHRPRLGGSVWINGSHHERAIRRRSGGGQLCSDRWIPSHSEYLHLVSKRKRPLWGLLRNLGQENVRRRRGTFATASRSLNAGTSTRQQPPWFRCPRVSSAYWFWRANGWWPRSCWWCLCSRRQQARRPMLEVCLHVDLGHNLTRNDGHHPLPRLERDNQPRVVHLPPKLKVIQCHANRRLRAHL